MPNQAKECKFKPNTLLLIFPTLLLGKILITRTEITIRTTTVLIRFDDRETARPLPPKEYKVNKDQEKVLFRYLFLLPLVW
jgi:hypothetical protein